MTTPTMPTMPTEILTERLVLRHFQLNNEEEIAAKYEYCTNATLTRSCGFKEYASYKEAQEYHNKFQALDPYTYAIRLRSTDKIVGCISLNPATVDPDTHAIVRLDSLYDNAYKQRLAKNDNNTVDNNQRQKHRQSTTEINPRHHINQYEAGYWIGEPHWSQGYLYASAASIDQLCV